MCGIVGFTGLTDIELLRKMNDSLIHRGPDDSGEFIDEANRVALAMRRLSIIDLRGGHQPMANEDETVWIIFNGEIYNFKALREELRNKGHKFKSDHSDTEVLIHLYEEDGPQMLDKLNGMFSFVIYDKRSRKLFAARDRVGIKPLYYLQANGVFAFASELKSLFLLKNVSKQIDYQSLYDYMSLQFTPAPRTIFKEIKKVPPAHYFIFDINSKVLKLCKYWDLSQNPNHNLKLPYLIERIQYETKRAVKDWSISDVPIACSLSGGIDSSSLVGLLSSAGIKDFKTFSLGFAHGKESVFDERNLAKLTAHRWGTDHFEIILEPDDLLKDLDQMVWSLDEPYGGGLPSWYIFKSMKGKVKVALTGTGGDELFGNYGKWRRYENIFSYLREFAKVMLFDSAPVNTLSMLAKYPQGYLYQRYFTESMKQNYLFNQEVFNGLMPTEKYIQSLWNSLKGKSIRDRVPDIDFKMQLPEEFLHMTDRFSMAHSIEARVPFLDHKLVELIMSIPACIRTNTNNLKYLFIKAMGNALSKEIVNGPKKGFVLPIDRWMRTSLKEQVHYYLGKDYLKKQGLFSQKLYSHIVKPYFTGRGYLKNCVWTAFMFQLWHKKYLGNN